MSSSLPPKPRVRTSTKVRICIVAATYNEEYSDGLVENAIDDLDDLLSDSKVDLIRVPGISGSVAKNIVDFFKNS